MGTRIKAFLDGSFLEYDKRKFDKWCVYMNLPTGTRRPPLDTEYFSQLHTYALNYGADRIYQDYIKVYDLVGKYINKSDLDIITDIALTYRSDSLEIDKIFSILYMAMIAEERKACNKLGKRVKRLGLHKLLCKGKNVQEAVNFMRGMKLQDIDVLCLERGF